MDRTLRAAEQIAHSRQSLKRLPPLVGDIRPTDLRDAYAIQDKVHEFLVPHRGRLVGYKIGCTSKVMQEYLAISHPCSGGVFEKHVFESGQVLRIDDYVRVGIECEIAVRLGKDLPEPVTPYTRDTVADAVEACFAAIEIVDDRYVQWETLGAPTLIADDFFAAGIVLGTPASATIDLLKVEGRALINGAEVGRGTGADLLGHPYNPLAWLANSLAEQGKALKKGQIVMTGSVIQTVWLNRGDTARMEFSDLGTVEVTFH